MLFVYILNLLIAVPLGYRFLIFCIFYLQMALIYGVLQVFSRHEKRVRLRYILRGMTIMFLLLIVFWNVNLLAKDLNRIAKKQQTIVARMEPLKAVIPPDAVVMVRNRIGWPLPTFTGKTIGAMRETHLYFEKNSRNKDVSIFFSDEVSLSKRLSIMRKYGASYIIFSTAGENSAVKQQLLSIPGEYFEVGEYTVIKVHL